MLKNESIPKDWPYWYKKVSIIGMATKKEKKMPRRKRIVIGKMNLKMVVVFALVETAGPINPNISFTISGIEPAIPSRKDTCIWANKD